jgi:hypothetical protein
MIIMFTSLMCLVLSSCGTVSGTLSGVCTGGVSLTDGFYKSKDGQTFTKTVGTPFVFVVGTVLGPVFGLAEGVGQDVDKAKGIPYDFKDLVDPFGNGDHMEP